MTTKEENLAKVMAMQTHGKGTFVLGGKRHTLDIVKMGKRDVTLRSNDGTLITFNKKGLESWEP